MPKAGRVKSIDSGRSKLRYQLAIACLALALTLLFIAVKFQTKEYLTAAPLEKRADHTYSRIWFDDADVLVGASWQGRRLTIHRWSGGPGEERQFDAGAPPEPREGLRWAMAADLSRLAWITGSALYSRTLAGGGDTGKALVSIALPTTPAPLDLGLLSDGSVAVVFANGKVERWDGATGQPLGERQLEPVEADQAVTDADYLAVSSSRAGRLLLYHFRDTKDWILAGESPAPDPPYRLVIPAPGVMATFTAAGLRVGSNTKNTPGALKSAASHLDSLIVSGDFDKVMVLPEEGDRYALADAAPGSSVAAGRANIAVSGPNGTVLFKLGTENRLTGMGRKVSFASFAALVLAGLLAAGPLLLSRIISLLIWIIRGTSKSEGKHIPQTLEAPPLELVKAFAAGEGALWAGAGLSAQSGLPLRGAFISSIFQAAVVENWTGPPLTRKLQGLCTRGAFEEALNELVEAKARLRSELIAHYRAILCKFAAPSKCHEILTRIPFAGAITTNYDNLIERVGEVPAASILTLSSDRLPPAGGPFVLKLYGDLSVPQTALLSRAEFQSAIPGSAMAEPVRRVLRQRTLLFVGCSLEGLLADLAAIGTPKNTGGKHFAAAGVSGPAWEKQAAELSNRFGIQVLPCAAGSIASALPVFLESLAREVDKLQQASRPPECAATNASARC